MFKKIFFSILVVTFAVSCARHLYKGPKRNDNQLSILYSITKKIPKLKNDAVYAEIVTIDGIDIKRIGSETIKLTPGAHDIEVVCMSDSVRLKVGSLIKIYRARETFELSVGREYQPLGQIIDPLEGELHCSSTITMMEKKS